MVVLHIFFLGFSPFSVPDHYGWVHPNSLINEQCVVICCFVFNRNGVGDEVVYW